MFTWILYGLAMRVISLEMIIGRNMDVNLLQIGVYFNSFSTVL